MSSFFFNLFLIFEKKYLFDILVEAEVNRATLNRGFYKIFFFQRVIVRKMKDAEDFSNPSRFKVHGFFQLAGGSCDIDISFVSQNNQ